MRFFCHISDFLYQIWGLKQIVVRFKRRVICAIRNEKYGAHDELSLKALTLLKIGEVFFETTCGNSIKMIYQEPRHVMHMFSVEPSACNYSTSSSVDKFSKFIIVIIVGLYFHAPYEQSSCIRLNRDAKAHLSNSNIRIKFSKACACKLAVPLGPDIMWGHCCYISGGWECRLCWCSKWGMAQQMYAIVECAMSADIQSHRHWTKWSIFIKDGDNNHDGGGCVLR